MKQKFVVTGAALALMLGGAGVASAAPSGDPAFANCTEAKAAGQESIPQSSPLYAEALDRDSDGVACDAKDVAAAGAVATDPPVTGADDTSLDADDAAGSPDDEHDDGDHADDADHDDEQVSVVPEGGAPTGDGSTEDGPAGGVAWWLGGALLGALAAAGMAFRERLARLVRR